MKELLFRAWDTENNEYFMEGNALDLDYSLEQGCLLFDNDAAYATKGLILEQYTGADDITGKKAYHHDHVKSKHYDGIGEVVWYGHGWVVKVDGTLFSLSYEFTIVGHKTF